LTFQTQYLYGYLLALGAAFCWALFSVLNKTKNYEPISSVFLFNLVGLIFMTFVMFFTNSSFNISAKEIIGTFYIGLFPTAIAFILWIKALQIGKASFIANLGHLSPFISLIFIFIILGEKILASEIIGLIIIISGILLQIKKRK
jgi:drug/metabolite transporter (DMT)-like permease